jgi:effector-binding domain-containing protein
MITQPEIVESPEQAIALIHVTVPRDEIMAAMRAGLDELSAALRVQKVEPVGPWFTHHLRRPSESFDFRICFPVAQAVKATGRVEPGVREAATVARTVYSGNYTGLVAAWGQFREWIEANNYQPRADLWETYLVGPEASGRPEEWRTELNRPLV